jgi:hypothetical protein
MKPNITWCEAVQITGEISTNKSTATDFFAEMGQERNGIFCGVRSVFTRLLTFK